MPENPAVDREEPRASSAGSWAAGNPFVGNAGPEFDPEAAGETPVTPLYAEPVLWTPMRVKTMVRGQGLLTHEAIGVGLEDWLWRDSELAAVSEPLSNVLNKHPVTRAAAGVSDEITVGVVMFEYAARSIKERSQVMRERKRRAAQQQPPRPQPVTGVDAAGERVTPPPPDSIQWETIE